MPSFIPTLTRPLTLPRRSCAARLVVLSLVAFSFAVSSEPAAAEPTEITVRVLGKDSKFVGTSMGGARVILRDAETGEILAKGMSAIRKLDDDALLRLVSLDIEKCRI